MPYKYKEMEKEYMRQYALEHRDEERERKRRWRLEHKEEHRLSGRRTAQKLKFLVLQTYSHANYPCCVRCNIDDIDVLTIDHINGGGNQHRREIGKKASLYQWLKNNNFPDGYQTLCWNCNAKKHINSQITE